MSRASFVFFFFGLISLVTAQEWNYQSTFLYPAAQNGCGAQFQDAAMVSVIYTTSCAPADCRAVAPSFAAVAANASGLAANVTSDGGLFTFMDVNNTSMKALGQTYWWAYTTCTSTSNAQYHTNLEVAESAAPGCPAGGTQETNPLYITYYTKGCVSGPVSSGLNSFQAYCDSTQYYVVGYPDASCGSSNYTVIQNKDIGCLVYTGAHANIDSVLNACLSSSGPAVPGAASSLAVSLQMVSLSASAVYFAIHFLL